MPLVATQHRSTAVQVWISIQSPLDQRIADEDQCMAFTTCTSCASAPNCGWCDNMLCLVGNATGPVEGSCQTWVFRSNTCNDPDFDCTDFTTCTSCVLEEGCAWCNSTQKCLPNTTSTYCDHWLPHDCQGCVSTIAAPIDLFQGCLKSIVVDILRVRNV